MKAKLFDRTTIDNLQWHPESGGEKFKEFLAPLVKNGIRSYVDNIDADFYVLQVGSIILPIVVANENYKDSYVCSPYGHYFAQAQKSDRVLPNRFLRNLTRGFSKGLGKISRKAKINSAVFVNNWLSATDTYPAGLNKSHIKAIISTLTERFPNHAIVFRSLNSQINGSLIQDVESLGCHMIASRQVYLNDTKQDVAFRRRDTKRDIKLLEEGPYTVVDESHLDAEDFKRLQELYSKLYIVYHTPLSPQFNVAFFQIMLNSGLMGLRLVKHNGKIEGMAAYYEQDGVLVSPLIGFDKAHPKNGEIYQLLSLSLLLAAKKNNLIWHQSAGASAYKKNRGAVPCLESMAVYANHLPIGRRLFWDGFKRFINTFAVPFMERY